MNDRTFRLIAVLMFAIGAAVRINNALVFSPLRGYDGYAHFSYIWYMAENWRVPLPTSAWEFFQPPLYYAYMAAVWDALAGTDAILRLQVGTLVLALLGLVHAWASMLLVRRVLPGNRLAELLAAGLGLFLPVHLYSAGFIGNEYLSAVCCTFSVLALMRVLDRPTVLRALVLGLALGIAMMSKFTGFVVVAGAFFTLGVRTVLRREWMQGLRTMTVAGVVMLLCCGWFYGRNVMLYGTPFKMSRETFVLARYENIQTKGRRNIWEYILFDPMLLRRPQWPRGVPLVQEVPALLPYNPAAESVPSGLYANTWFDGYGGWVLPAVIYDNTVRRCGQFLMTFGLVPSVLVLAGFFLAIGRVWRKGWDDTLVAMLACTGAMAAVVIQGTSSVATHAAVKATYLLPISTVFGLWFALGVDWVQRRRPRWLKPVVASCVLLAAVSCTVFLQGRTVARYWFDESWLSPMWLNMYGVIYNAAGDEAKARDYFRRAADQGQHLAYENLAILDMDEEPLQAVHYLRTALRVQPLQSLGTPSDRIRFNNNTASEYLNTLAVVYHRMGWTAAAEDAAKQSVDLDRTFPEASYDLAVLAAENALTGPASREKQARDAWLARSRRLLFDTLVMDSAFVEARVLAATLEAAEGRCDEADAALAAIRREPKAWRLYPVDTGIGDMLAASIKRRRHITDLPPALTPGFQLARCRGEAGESHGS